MHESFSSGPTRVRAYRFREPNTTKQLFNCAEFKAKLKYCETGKKKARPAQPP